MTWVPYDMGSSTQDMQARDAEMEQHEKSHRERGGGKRGERLTERPPRRAQAPGLSLKERKTPLTVPVNSAKKLCKP
jgi:hypothetical protein